MFEDMSRDEIFSFRMIGLSEMSLATLHNVLPSVAITVRRNEKGIVASFKITAALNLEPLYTFLCNEAVEPSKYSVWISVITSSDHSGVSLPAHVLELIRRTTGGVDFSFVACLGES